MDKKQYASIRMPKQLYDRIKAEANKNTRSFTGQVIHMLQSYLDEQLG